MGAARPELAALTVADPPERWAALGFDVDGSGAFALDGVQVRLGGTGTGITDWSVRGLDPAVRDVDGLALTPAPEKAPPGERARHPNGAIAFDHVVVITPDFDRTAAALDRVGMPLRRVRDAGSFRQGFRRLGPAILELVESVDQPPGPARFWGLVAVIDDLEGLRERLAPHVGEVRTAVQPGRHIATLAASAGLSVAVAFMDPEPGQPRR